MQSRKGCPHDPRNVVRVYRGRDRDHCRYGSGGMDYDETVARMNAVALPRQIVDQLRAERGGIVDFAVRAGRIVIVDKKVGGNGDNSKN